MDSWIERDLDVSLGLSRVAIEDNDVYLFEMFEKGVQVVEL